MTARLRAVSVDRYAAEILPMTHALWANGRSFDTYVAQTTALATSAYGRRSYRTFGLHTEGAEPVASFKWYERAAHLETKRLRCIGIGAVFTPVQHRGKGYASAMLALALDRARDEGFDFAYLFSDIHPQFYRAIGFVELPSRTISMRSDSLPNARIKAEPLRPADWPALRRCFDAMNGEREWALDRGATFWNWLRLRTGHGSEHASGQPVHLVARRNRDLAAYVIGQREPRHDAYVVDEFGYAGRGEALIGALMRCAAGDLRRIVGWLPPVGARDVLPRGSVRRRSDAIWMAAPLSKNGAAFIERAAHSGNADGVWSSDHI